MKRAILPGLALTLALLLPLVATADSLTDERVRAFINTLQDAETLEEDLDELNQDLPDADHGSEMPDFSSIFSDSVDKMRGHDTYDRMEAIVEDHGFDSMEAWGATGDRVFQAWMAIEVENQHPEMAREMAGVMDEINNNPSLSEAQKEQMRTMMGGATSAMETARQAPESDKQAVRPHMETLRAVTESDGDY